MLEIHVVDALFGRYVLECDSRLNGVPGASVRSGEPRRTAAARICF